MSYDEFNRRMSRMRPEERNNYLIIQPKDIEGALGRITEEPTTAYTKRTDAMNKMGVMIKNYVMGYGASLMRQDEQMIKFLSQVEKSPDFEAFLPPSLKVGSYYLLGRAYFLQKNYDMALEYAGKAIELDHDLDKPSGDWPGYEYSANLPTKYGIDSRPFELAGDAFLGKDMPAEAKKYYYKALAIYPKNAGLKEKITLTQKKQ
jgi:tetratricopeptide (TPR) repeat protein